MTTPSPAEALLAQSRLVPVLTIDRVEDAVPLARALVAGGITTLEITLRTAAAPAAIEAIAAAVPEAVIGLGTVLTPADLELGLKLGARFALSPGATPELLDAAASLGLPFIPGIATASELMAAMQRGFRAVKFFPAVPAGGIPALKALGAPFPMVRFCPTGGIGEEQAAEWLALPNVLAVGGSWLAPPALMRAGQWDAITDIARRSLARLP
ncbi:bifunctional 4-hydroxy-2-oxoglutarate aldolase/2-dehydro-3-deoxy-phosphogluconate aldolase [Roseomonas sp. GC11]|uniref:bifunctional 4-hydroxy-2-oxoglutarate aldolase/2-dehydro-3-deoxy-phosphogluconate aldolase n=1 Tax=Roseomonas sp. GC11 TaxID=2950546 RepID=UPI002108AFA3|nr:bifunctional 4-hydroxy-2-oxoglutarate aldolase/2-dehydro-3-deoxy-phosphogluconate aldolase [Roseomonas sp. GC11]MCQ4161832.1 bifunctional 4-hydroxy-2-oxoglutarate aldolase/2-dehydro-3-deoxy-phosphogluconate aldolase [Roseomonas sp. GC11]